MKEKTKDCFQTAAAGPDHEKNQTHKELFDFGKRWELEVWRDLRLERVEEILQKYPEAVLWRAQSGGQYCRTMLHYASLAGRLDIVKCLVNAGAPVDTQDMFGSTALFHACWGNRVSIVKFLIKQGSDIHHQSIVKKSTPLHFAISHQSYACIRTLLLRGASPEIANADDQTPLQQIRNSQYLDPETKTALVFETALRARENFVEKRRRQELEAALAVVRNGLPYDLKIGKPFILKKKP